jgi:hypothetical protein
MVKHIVVWKLKPHAEGADKATNARLIKERLEAMRGKITGLRSVEVGINYNDTPAAFDVALYCELDSREALDAYQSHPAHLHAVELISRVREQRIVVDYDA